MIVTTIVIMIDAMIATTTIGTMIVMTIATKGHVEEGLPKSARSHR